MISSLFLSLFLFGLGLADDCPTCPTGGIWSEWTTTGTCATTCGACSTLTYTRTCLSTTIPDCDCVGASTINKVCNTQACNYPRANGPGAPCCVGSPMVIDNWYHCGPIEVKNVSAFCCPVGGIWGQWTPWVKSPTTIEWNRKRECISSGFSCQCTGEVEETKSDCPCEPLQVVPTGQYCTLDQNTANKTANSRSHQYQKGICTAVIVLEASNFFQEYLYASGTNVVSDVGYVLNGDMKCHWTKFKVGALNTNGQYQSLEFSCDLETGQWATTNTYSGDDLTGITHFSQYYTPRAT